MNKITSLTSPNRIDNVLSPVQKTSNSIPVDSDNKIIRRDYFIQSENQVSQDNLKKMIIEDLRTMQKEFSKVQIFTGHGLDRSQLKYNAAALGEGKHLIISEDWLKQITASPETYEQGKQILYRVLSQISDDEEFSALGAYIDVSGVQFWASGSSLDKENEALKEEYEGVVKQLENMKETLKSKEKMYKVKPSKSVYSVSESYARLSGARSKSQVRSAMSQARRNISTLRSESMSTDASASEKAKARASISSYQKLLLRGARKIRRLNEEELIALRKKRAEKKAQALRLKIELQKKKSARRNADSAIALEGHLDDVNNAFRFHKQNKDEEPEEGRIYTPYLTEAAVQTSDTSATFANAAISPSDISVSSVISFGEL